MPVTESDVESLPGAASPAADTRRIGGRGNPHSTPPARYIRCRLGAPPSRAFGWRQRTLIGARWKVEQGELPRQAFVALELVLSFSDTRGKDVDYFTIVQMGEKLQWAGRTMAEWLRELYERGWLEKAHRCHRNELGQVRGLPNRWRPSRPPDVESYLEGVAYMRPKTVKRPGRYTPPMGLVRTPKPAPSPGGPQGPDDPPDGAPVPMPAAIRGLAPRERRGPPRPRGA